METKPIPNSLRPPDFCEPAKNIMIATPTLGRVVAYMAGSVHGAAYKALLAGISMESHVNVMDAYIDRSRNALVTAFLESEATDILFIDDDVGFPEDAILKICNARRPFVGGAYRKKDDNPKDKNPFWLDFFQGTSLAVNDEGLIEVPRLTCGFLRLNKVVFDYMPCRVFKDDDKFKFDFFRTGVEGGEERIGWRGRPTEDEKVGIFVGEDYGFSQRWRDRGGKIWLMPDIKFSHTGSKTWHGSVAEWLEMAKAASNMEGGHEVAAAAE